LPKDFGGRGYRCTDGAVYCVVENHGAIYFGEERRELSPHDCLVIPPWQLHRFTAESDCVLFSFPDCAVQEAAGFGCEFAE